MFGRPCPPGLTMQKCRIQSCRTPSTLPKSRPPGRCPNCAKRWRSCGKQRGGSALCPPWGRCTTATSNWCVVPVHYPMWWWCRFLSIPCNSRRPRTSIAIRARRKRTSPCCKAPAATSSTCRRPTSFIPTASSAASICRGQPWGWKPISARSSFQAWRPW